MSAVPPRSPLVTTSVVPGRIRSTRWLRRTEGSISSALTPTMPEASSSGSGPGATRTTSPPGTRRRSRPCQPRTTSGAEIDAQASPSSAATGPKKMASLRSHPPGSACGSIGSAAETQIWRRPSGRSMFSKTGPFTSLTSATSTAASRRTWSSRAFAASSSAPTSARTRTPSRPSVSEPYVTAPPRRQPRGSAVVTSRDAAPTTRTVGGPSRSPDRAVTSRPERDRVYPAGPFPQHPEPFLVFLRAA
jgi:hypothetical protein